MLYVEVSQSFMHQFNLYGKKINVFFTGTGDYETVESLFSDDFSIPKVKLNEGLRIAVENGNVNHIGDPI